MSLLRSSLLKIRNIRWRTSLLLAIGFPFAMTPSTHAQFVQAQHGAGGTWNVYEYVPDLTTWVDAVTDAENREFNTTAGQLVELQSFAESAFVEVLLNDHIDPTDLFRLGGWIGLTDREGAAPERLRNGIIVPQESRTLDNPLTDGWAWVSGAPFEINNWRATEPRDFKDGEDAVYVQRIDGFWNDMYSGYDLNEPVVPTLQPGTSGAETRIIAQPYIVEYPVQSSTPLADIPIYSPVNRMPSFVELAPVGDGSLAVTAIHADLHLSRNTLKMAKELEEFGASQLMQRVTTVSAETANMSWSIAEEPPRPNTLPLEPGDGVSVARGVIRVPETGTYTFQVQNTGNFVLQLGDAEFEHAYGYAAIDRVDPSIMYFSGTTLEPKSRASVHLTAGLHELTFLNSGLAGQGTQVFWEITTASGDVPDEGDATWLALGDGSSVGEHVVTPIAHLVSAAQVINVDYNSRSFVTDVEFARAVLEDEDSQLPHYERNDVTTLVVSDGESDCCARPSQNLPEENRYLLPINDESLGGSKSILDNFYTRVSGQLVLDDGDEDTSESLKVTFAVFGQNQMQFHIEGVDFTWGHISTELDYVVGADVALTDNSQPELGPPGSLGMFGTAVLNEGQVYDFDGIVVNARDQAAYEVWVAPGANISRFDPRVFSPLSSTLLSRTVPGNVGLTFAGSKLGDFNGDGLLDV
ncbi:MAG: hypothetical protein KDA92_21045, partial [Planctomycetales bacterium]|nr:hypothetical protein [Planctomycetales bacterium]